MLKFITGNKNKFAEVKHLLKPIELEQMDIELIEIQDIDPKKIIEFKLKEALLHHRGPFIIEDSSLILEALGWKLPGPFIKYFNEHFGYKNLAKLAIRARKQQARGIVMIAYAKDMKNILFFKGEIEGRIVSAKGKYGFGYDPIFMPKGSSKTLGEMKAKNNFSTSARGLAVSKLKKYLIKNDKSKFK